QPRRAARPDPAGFGRAGRPRSPHPHPGFEVCVLASWSRWFRPEWNINFTIYPFDRIIDPSIGKCRLNERTTEPMLGRHDDRRSSSFLPFEPQLVITVLARDRPRNTDLSTSIRQGTVFGSVCRKFMQCQRKVLCMLRA